MAYQQRGRQARRPRRRPRVLHRHQLPEPPGPRAPHRRRASSSRAAPPTTTRSPRPSARSSRRRSSCRRTTASWARSAWRSSPASACSAPASPPRSAAGTCSRSTTRCVDFVCKACTNECDVRQFTIEGEKTYWGDKCSDRYRKPAKVDKEPVIADLIAFREEQLLAPYEAARARVPESAPTVGFARAMYTYDRLPFWSTFFAELGIRPVLSPESDKAIREAGVALTVAEPCFPIRVAHGHVAVAVQRGRRLGLRAQPGQRRDRVHAVQLARLPVGPDPAVRGQARAGARGAPRQDPRPARALPRRARGAHPRLRRDDADGSA